MTNELMERTHYCSETARLSPGDVAVVSGWVRKRRDLGKLIFVDLYDRSGILQVIFDPDRNPEWMEAASDLKRESVITVEGKISPRPADALNPSMETGKIELIASRLNLHNTSKTPPFHLIGDQDVAEELRLRYRYLDLRRPEMFRILNIRHQTQQVVHDFYTRNGFLDVVTPHLIRSTPEGARDFLVPSRLHQGHCYALPQSPQMLKQILMIAGVDRYFQIVKCFRDEDSRADRQPEFSQIDVEMSFVSRDTLFRIHEALMKEIYTKVLGVAIQTPFQRMTYVEAMLKYGSDKPDVRFGVEISDLSSALKESGFAIVDSTLADGGAVRGLVYPGGAKLSRKQVSELEPIVKKRGAGGLMSIKIDETGMLTGHPLAKTLNAERQATLIGQMAAKPGDLICIVAGPESTVAWALGDLRLAIGKAEKLIDSSLRFLWVIDFPLLEHIPEENRYQAMHHPFTAPVLEDAHLLDTAPERCRAQAYDLVLNGVELGGGSVRIHNPDIQEKVFKTIGMSREEAESRFGFFLEALSYGTPPHCGIAFGLDRLIMLLVGTDNLRDVIPFPKTLQAVCLLTEAPSSVDDEQLKTVGLKWIRQEK